MAEDKQKLIQDILNRKKFLEQRREKWEERWQDITDYVLPRLSDFDATTPSDPDKKTRNKMYDSTSVDALRLASDGMQGYMTPRSSPWFHMRFQNNELDNDTQSRKWVQETEEAMYAELARSNFYEQLGQAYDNGFSVGTSTVGVDDDEQEGKLVYRTHHPKEVYIAENKFGQVDTVYREFFMTGKQLEETFGKEKLPENLLERNKSHPYEQHKVIHAIYPRTDRITERITSENKPFASVYILESGQHLLRESGFDDMRYAVWRFRTNPGEEWGVSPAWDSFTDILRANQVSRTMLKAAQLAVEPPVRYPANMRGMIEINPRGMIPYTHYGEKIEPIDVLGQYPLGREEEEQLKQAIRNHFRVDFYLMLSQSDRQKTATEVMEIAGEKAAIMGTTIGRIESELLDPLLEITFKRLYKAGRLPQMPQVLADRPGEAMKIEYVGPLAQLQRRHHGQQSLTQTLSQVAPIVELFPESRDHIDSDKLMRSTLQDSGLDQEIIRDESDVGEIRQMRAQQQQQAEKLEMMERMAKLAPQLNKAQTGGNPMARTAQRAGSGDTGGEE